MAPTAQMLKLLSYTQGVPYLRRDLVSGAENFTSLIQSALTSSGGLTSWFAEKNKIIALWQQWFNEEINNPVFSGNGTISPVIKGQLNKDAAEVAYAMEYGDASVIVSWFKKVWQPSGTGAPTATSGPPAPSSTDDNGQYQAVGMPGINVATSAGMSRFAGFLPKVGDIGAEVYSGSLLWGSLAGPLAKNMMSQLDALGKDWWNKIGKKTDTGSTLSTDVETQTDSTVDAQGDPRSASNLDTQLGTVEGDTTSDTVAKASAKAGNEVLADSGGETAAAPFLQGVEFAPGIIGLAGVAFFAYLPIYLKGKRKHMDLRLELVNSTTQPVSWSYSMLQDGTPLQAPADTVVPASQSLMISNQAFTGATLTSHGVDFEFGNDSKGNNPLQLVMNLTFGASVLAVAVSIDKKGVCRSWAGLRAGTDTDGSLMERCQSGAAQSQASAPVSGVQQLSCNVASDPQSSTGGVLGYSALIHLE